MTIKIITINEKINTKIETKRNYIKHKRKENE